MTNYRILKRLRDGSLVQGGDYETNGPEQAMKRALAADDNGATSMRLDPGETLVAVPVGNWTEQGAREKVTRTIELFDPDASLAPPPGSGRTDVPSDSDDPAQS